MVGAVLQPDRTQHGPRLADRNSIRLAEEGQRKPDVLERGQERKQSRRLKRPTDGALAKPVEVAPTQRIDLQATHVDRARIRPVQAPYQREQSALPRARSTEQHNQLGFLDHEVDSNQSLDAPAGTEVFRYSLDHSRLSHSGRPWLSVRAGGSRCGRPPGAAAPALSARAFRRRRGAAESARPDP